MAKDAVTAGPGLTRALSLIMAMQVRALLKRKRLVFLIVILLLPPFVTLMMKLESSRALEEWRDFMPQAYFVFLIPILSLFHGASAIADEVDDRTMSYLLMRPVPRDAIVAGKVFGGAFVTTILASFSIALSHQLIYWAGSVDSLLAGGRGLELLRLIGIAAWGSLLYTSFAALLSLVVKRPTLAGIVYILLAEIAACYVPGPLARISMSTHFMRLMPEDLTRVEVLIAEEGGFDAPSADPWAALGLLLFVSGSLGVLLLKRFRNFDLSGGTEGDQ